MTVLDDLVVALNDYADDHVTLRVVDFNEPGPHINTGETCSFRVEVVNDGHLDMNGLRLHIEGSPRTRVSRTPLGFSASIISGRRDAAAHSTVRFGAFFMRADSATGNQGTDNEDLITVHVSTFNASLAHMLLDHGHHSEDAAATYQRHIHPD